MSNNPNRREVKWKELRQRLVEMTEEVNALPFREYVPRYMPNYRPYNEPLKEWVTGRGSPESQR